MDSFLQITHCNSKMVLDKHILFIKVKWEVIGAVSNGDIACDLVSPPPKKKTPNSTYCVAFIYP